MSAIINWFRRIIGIRRPAYVIIYDMPDDNGGASEEYYGYFADPAEARHLWGTFNQSQQLENVKLCRVVEDW